MRMCPPRTNTHMPMGELDNYDEEMKINCPMGDDYQLMLDHVICGEHGLLYIDTFLKEIFASETVN